MGTARGRLLPPLMAVLVAVVRNLGGMDARNIVVSLDPDPGAFVPTRQTRVIARLPHGRVAQVSFTLTPVRRGSHRVGLSATSSSNQTTALSTILVNR